MPDDSRGGVTIKQLVPLVYGGPWAARPSASLTILDLRLTARVGLPVPGSVIWVLRPRYSPLSKRCAGPLWLPGNQDRPVFTRLYTVTVHARCW